jgi:uncharacterized membrane protein YobD (UPF0266 family)
MYGKLTFGKVGAVIMVVLLTIFIIGVSNVFRVRSQRGKWRVVVIDSQVVYYCQKRESKTVFRDCQQGLTSYKWIDFDKDSVNIMLEGGQ